MKLNDFNHIWRTVGLIPLIWLASCEAKFATEEQLKSELGIAPPIAPTPTPVVEATQEATAPQAPEPTTAVNATVYLTSANTEVVAPRATAGSIWALAEVPAASLPQLQAGDQAWAILVQSNDKSTAGVIATWQVPVRTSLDIGSWNLAELVDNAYVSFPSPLIISKHAINPALINVTASSIPVNKIIVLIWKADIGIVFVPAGAVIALPTDLKNATTPEDTVKVLNFVLDDADGKKECADVSVSYNSSLVLSPGIVSGSRPNCILTLTPKPNMFGSTDITLTVVKGLVTATDIFTLLVLPENDPPILSSAPTITPSILNTTNTSATCSAAGTDDDGDVVSINYQWDVQNADTWQYSGATLSGMLFTKGESVRCRAKASTGAIDSAWSIAAITVDNSRPTITGTATLDPVQILSSAFSCHFAGTTADVDSDAVTLIYSLDSWIGSVWTEVASVSTASSNVDFAIDDATHQVGSSGDVVHAFGYYRCRIRAFDGVLPSGADLNSPSVQVQTPIEFGSPLPAAVFSLRKLLTSYSGMAIQVAKESALGTVTDIGFLPDGSLDQASLATACAGEACKVIKWYDQRGTFDLAYNNAPCNTLTPQPPEIRSASGFLQVIGTEPALKFSGTNQILCRANGPIKTKAQGASSAIMAVWQPNGFTTFQTVVEQNLTSITTSRRFGFLTALAGTYGFSGENSDNFAVAVTGITANTSRITTLAYSSPALADEAANIHYIHVFDNGVHDSTADIPSGAALDPGNQYFGLGAKFNGTEDYNGLINTVLVYNDSLVLRNGLRVDAESYLAQGTGVTVTKTRFDGLTQAKAHVSCLALKNDGYNRGDGLYWLNPNRGSTADAFQGYCDMTGDGGGWTLVARELANKPEPATSTGSLSRLGVEVGGPSALASGSASALIGLRFEGAYSEVRFKNGSSEKYIFTPSAGIFVDTINVDIPITMASSSSAQLTTWLSSGAKFCRAGTSTNSPGDTSWAIKPVADNNTACGCNTHGWAAQGAFYGGFNPASACVTWGGGWAGVKTNGEQKGSQRQATEVTLWVR